MQTGGMDPLSPALEDEALEALRALTGRPDATFHDGQFEAISALVEQRRRVLVVQRTGWGKSAVYFLSALLQRRRGAGPALIISPLIALMRDQVAAARRARGVEGSGGGEWAVYFLSALLQRRRGAGPALIISPLIALMRDQVAAARRAGVRAEAISSANPTEWRDIEEGLAADELDVLL